MPKKPSADYFRIIKQNHKKYLERNMVSHLEVVGGLHQAEKIQKYGRLIADYQSDKERYLKYAIEQQSTGAKIGHGALAALLGVGAGGVSYYLSQNGGITTAINPLPNVQNIVGGVFNGLIGTGVAYIAYQAWLASSEHAATADFAQFQEEMTKAGFTNEKYAELSAELVKLFHYRECLLLGLKDNTGMNMREEFKEHYSPDNEPFDEDALNQAIEIYFLTELNRLFNNAFTKIYELQDREIRDEEASSVFLNWFKNYFESPKNRKKFTQQMQIQFMELCLNYLEAEMSEKSHLAKNPLFASSLGGLAAGAVVISLAAVVLGGPITWSIAAVGLVITCLAATGVYWTSQNVDALHYKRSKENRAAIQESIESISKENKRLKQLLKNVVPTSDQDIEALQKYKTKAKDVSVFQYIFGGKKHHVAMGTESAWIREYAARYRHGKHEEIDLARDHKEIITQGKEQTKALQEVLVDFMNSDGGKPEPWLLLQFINDTREYLNEGENQDFIKNFGLIDKIKEQVLEIVAAVNLNCTRKSLPQSLIDFYCLPREEGGLGGLYSDLQHVRELAAIVPEDSSSQEFYKHLSVKAQRFNYALTRDVNKAYILKGEPEYRSMLGLAIDAESEQVENKITLGNVHQYLQHSFDFLYSLNRRVLVEDSNGDLDRPFNHSQEFQLYRMLLLKQLASLSDPNNPRVKPSIRHEIYAFVAERFQIDPEKVFDDLLNQSLFMERDSKGPFIKDELGRNLSIQDLEYIGDALRLDLAYASKPITPRMLITMEAKYFLANQGANKIIFSHNASDRVLTPENTDNFIEKIQEAIEMTNQFILEMNKRNTLKKTGALAYYLQDVLKTVQSLRKSIEQLDVLISEGDKAFIHSEKLSAADTLLRDYEKEIKSHLSTKASPLENSVIQFGKFGKQPVINLCAIEEWEILVECDPIEDFINSVAEYIELRKNEPQYIGFYFFAHTKDDKLQAAEALKQALEGLKNNEHVDTAFLAMRKSCFAEGRLKEVIFLHLNKFRVNTLDDFFKEHNPPRQGKPILN